MEGPLNLPQPSRPQPCNRRGTHSSGQRLTALRLNNPPPAHAPNPSSFTLKPFPLLLSPSDRHLPVYDPPPRTDGGTEVSPEPSLPAPSPSSSPHGTGPSRGPARSPQSAAVRGAGPMTRREQRHGAAAPGLRSEPSHTRRPSRRAATHAL